MICSNCGTENEAGRKFCGECATPLAVLCPNCATPNPPTVRFCGECATPLKPAESAPARFSAAAVPGPAEHSPAQDGPDHVAERRLVSVLFADLVGFTPFAEERDAEEVRDTLSRYFELASDVITRYGGTVEKFIGDAVMAVWALRRRARMMRSGAFAPPWTSSTASGPWAPASRRGRGS